MEEVSGNVSKMVFLKCGMNEDLGFPGPGKVEIVKKVSKAKKATNQTTEDASSVITAIICSGHPSPHTQPHP